MIPQKIPSQRASGRAEQIEPASVFDMAKRPAGTEKHQRVDAWVVFDTAKAKMEPFCASREDRQLPFTTIDILSFALSSKRPREAPRIGMTHSSVAAVDCPGERSGVVQTVTRFH